MSWRRSKIINESATQTPGTVSILVELEKDPMTLHAERMFQFYTARGLGCEAQGSRVGEAHSGHFKAARREFCMMADSESLEAAEGNERGSSRMWCCLKRPPRFAV